MLGLNPYHFNQVVSKVKPKSVCATPVKQWAWQESDQIGREDIAQAIQAAEDTIADYLGYRLLPTWEVEERHLTVAPGFVGLIKITPVTVEGFRTGVVTDWGHLISGGIEAKSVIEAGAAVVYSDENGDGELDTATLTITTTVTEADEIAVYFPGESGADDWEVRPISVSISGGVATIVIGREQLVDPGLWDALAPTSVDITVAGSFLSTVDVYRHYNDPQQQVRLLWNPRPVHCDCGDGTCDACTKASQFGCLNTKDYKAGSVAYAPATWNSTTEVFDVGTMAVDRNPDIVFLWYYAGFQAKTRTLPRIQMDGQLERAIAYYALTLLDRKLCGCNNLDAMVKHWRADLSLALSAQAVSESYQVGATVTENPFGPTRGAVYAWNVVNQDKRKLGKAVAY